MIMILSGIIRRVAARRPCKLFRCGHGGINGWFRWMFHDQERTAGRAYGTGEDGCPIWSSLSFLSCTHTRHMVAKSSSSWNCRPERDAPATGLRSEWIIVKRCSHLFQCRRLKKRNLLWSLLNANRETLLGREEIGAAVRAIECSAQSEQGITNVPATATVPKFLTLQPLPVPDTPTPCEIWLCHPYHYPLKHVCVS